MDDNLTQRRQRCQQEKANPSSGKPIDRFKNVLFLRMGPSGIKNVGRMFKIMDDDGNRSLNIDEFKKGVSERGLDLKDHEINELYDEFDKDNSGSINYDEFLASLRGPMSQSRLKLIDMAYAKMDVTGDGVINVEDLKGYDPRHHPKFKSGEWTATECRLKFLESFDVKDQPTDGTVTKDEFINYYAGVSSNIDDDAYFDLMMRNAWRL